MKKFWIKKCWMKKLIEKIFVEKILDWNTKKSLKKNVDEKMMHENCSMKKCCIQNVA